MSSKNLSEAVVDFLGNPPHTRVIYNSGAEFLLADGAERIPVSVPIGSSGLRCLVSSVTSALSSYAGTRIHDIDGCFISKATKLVTNSSSFFLDCLHADDCTMLYNLPFSTVLFPELDAVSLRDSIASVERKYQRPVVVRGLNDLQHPHLLAELRRLDFVIIPYRRILLVTDPEKAIAKSRIARRELRLRDRFSQLRLGVEVDFPLHEICNALEMYRKLYIKRYSCQNADYSEDFLERAFSSGLLAPITLRDCSGKLIGFVAIYENDDTVTAPLIGYDVEGQLNVPAYRMLMIELLRYARDVGKILNWSSGVSEFKMLRGAAPFTEILAIQPRTLLHRFAFDIYASALRRVMISGKIHAMLGT